MSCVSFGKAAYSIVYSRMAKILSLKEYFSIKYSLQATYVYGKIKFFIPILLNIEQEFQSKSILANKENK